MHALDPPGGTPPPPGAPGTAPPPGAPGTAPPPGAPGAAITRGATGALRPAGVPGAGTPAPAAQSSPGGKTVLGPAEIGRALTRIAHEILERTNGAADVVLLGIPTRGVWLAHRLAARLAQVEEGLAPAGSLDITMYRDDLRLRPARALGHTDLPAAGIDGRIVVLVDDVLYSGRTVRAALDALGDLGRPRSVQLAVLVDRGHRELPIRPDYVGKNLPTSQREVVRVLLDEVDGHDAVVLSEGVPGGSIPGESRGESTAGESTAGESTAGESTAGGSSAGGRSAKSRSRA